MPEIKNSFPLLPVVVKHLGHYYRIVFTATVRKPPYFDFIIHVVFIIACYNYFMLENGYSEIFTIGIGGAAGEGVKKTGINIGMLLHDLGLQVYLSVDYPSLIRGGHNFIRLSCSREKIWNDYTKLDILVCLNEETKEIHKNELKEGAWVLSGLSNSEITEKIKEFLKNKNFELNEEGNKSELIDGNTAFAKGLLAAGLDFYTAYPMTPATSILHYLASRQTPEGLKVIQPENEISVINMALGMVYAGKRATVGTATGGFALMQEAFSFAGQAELPLVVAVSQRQAPATGVPTRSSQSDLRFVIHAGSGEFPRIVIAPGDPEESFRAGADALNLAWKFKIPVIVLLDKILSEHMMTSSIDAGSVSVERNENIIFPGTPNVVVKATSYEHDEEGLTIDKVEDVKRMVDKRFKKAADIEAEMQNREAVKVYGDINSENAVVFFGSTKGPVLEASKYFNKPVKLLQIVWLEPLCTEKVKKELEGKRIICIEGNHNGQLASLIREKTGIEIKNKILKYDSSPFDPVELAEQINTLWN
jgi:2-oxoglutarate/2-oxoacid ferredoxin oxidoreductase subunit alpha